MEDGGWDDAEENGEEQLKGTVNIGSNATPDGHTTIHNNTCPQIIGSC